MDATSQSPITFEALAYDECTELLASAQVGRVAWLRDGRPTVVPVNYAWDGEAIVMRTDPGAKLHEITTGAIAFEVDEIDARKHTGWSVVVHGSAVEITESRWPDTAAALNKLGLVSWAPGTKDHWVRMAPHNITGRRLRAAPGGAENPFWRLSAAE